MGWLDKLKSNSAKPATPEQPLEATPPASAFEIDAAYYRWLTAAPPPRASPQREQHILDELARLAASPGGGAALVPRVPDIIPQLLRTLGSDDMNAAALARQLGADTVLVAEVYREANRPAYLPRYHAGPPVDSIPAAIMLLGQNGMRMLLARVALRPLVSLQGGRLARRSAPLIWRQSEKSALAASLLAPGLGANAFEAYLAGLMENVGLVVAMRIVDRCCADEALPWSDPFIASLFQHARTLSAQIAAQWEFPDPVVETIAGAGRDDAGASAQALALGGRLGKLRMLVDAAEITADDPCLVAGASEAMLAVFARLADDE